VCTIAVLTIMSARLSDVSVLSILDFPSLHFFLPSAELKAAEDLVTYGSEYLV